MELALAGLIGLGVIVAVLLALPLKELITYLISVKSRKHYVCPSCGERIMMEHGSASVCSACGAPLHQEVDR
jgi:ribosomal protein S27AE